MLFYLRIKLISSNLDSSITNQTGGNMLTTEILNKADKLQSSHEELIKFMDEIVADIDTLKLVLTKRKDFVKEEAFVDAIEAGNLIKKAREELSNDT